MNRFLLSLFILLAASMCHKELRARDSVAVRKLLFAIHTETGHEPEIYERMFDPSYDMTYWPGNIEVSRATNRVTVIRAAGVGDGKTPGYIPDEIGDLTELKQIVITQPLNKPVPESMKKCVSSTLHWNTLMLDGSGETFGQQNMKQQEGYVLYE